MLDEDSLFINLCLDYLIEISASELFEVSETVESLLPISLDQL